MASIWFIFGQSGHTALRYLNAVHRPVEEGLPPLRGVPVPWIDGESGRRRVASGRYRRAARLVPEKAVSF